MQSILQVHGVDAGHRLSCLQLAHIRAKADQRQCVASTRTLSQRRAHSSNSSTSFGDEATCHAARGVDTQDRVDVGGLDNLRSGYVFERLGDDLFFHEALLAVLELVVRGHVGQRRAASRTHTLVGLAWFWVVALHPADTLVQEVGKLHVGRARERPVVLAHESRLEAGQRQACAAMGFHKQLDQEQWVASVAGCAIAVVLEQHKLLVLALVLLFVGSTMMIVVVAVAVVAVTVTVVRLGGRGAHEHELWIGTVGEARLESWDVGQECRQLLARSSDERVADEALKLVLELGERQGFASVVSLVVRDDVAELLRELSFDDWHRFVVCWVESLLGEGV